jgi:hypothetical protein
MDRDWSLEVRLTFKKPIGDKRATRSWSQDAISRGYKCVDPQAC